MLCERLLLLPHAEPEERLLLGAPAPLPWAVSDVSRDEDLCQGGMTHARAHTHTCTHAHTHTGKHTHTHTGTHTLTHTDRQAHTHTPTRMHTHTQ